MACCHEFSVEQVWIVVAIGSDEVGFAYLHPMVEDAVEFLTDVLVSLLLLQLLCVLGLHLLVNTLEGAVLASLVAFLLEHGLSKVLRVKVILDYFISPRKNNL